MTKLIILLIIIIVIIILFIIGKKSISTEIIIKAPINKVWNELINFSKYPDWNPFIREIKGEIKIGNRIKVTFQIEDSKPTVFTPIILIIETNKIFQWEGKLFLTAVFAGRHTFELINIEKNKTKLIQREDFKGILVPIFNFDTTIKGFGLMNKAFKERIERGNFQRRKK